ncbi:hypothetical protein WAC87_003628 [Shigella flexneri]
MKAKRLLIITGASLLIACHAVSERRQPPTQVVYRFDDHRYLELTGFNCEGALWYTDTRKGIHTEIVDRFYRIFTKKYVHPSERYIAVTQYETTGVFFSKDYGHTWNIAYFSPGGGATRYGSWGMLENVESFTVVNDQGFFLTKEHDLYISSKPFDDPRMQPGGAGIDYIVEGTKHHLRPRDNGTSDNSYWGKDYTSWESVNGPDAWLTYSEETNWKNIPNKVPEVKNYTGWDHMRCDPDLGLAKKDE